ncbi:MAG: hypothetical protein JO345_01195 [Streptosporangiaceae bacterium]|nr:hypothetical protein [Streptosporangiaceae bacterium]
MDMRLGFAPFGGYLLLDDPQRRNHRGLVGAIRFMKPWAGQEAGGEPSLFGDFA